MRDFPAKIWVPVLLLGAVLVRGAIVSATAPPPPTQEQLAAQQEHAQQAKARHDYLAKKDHLSDAECLELYGPDADKPDANGNYGLCQRYDADDWARGDAMRERTDRDLIEQQKAAEARKYFGIK